MGSMILLQDTCLYSLPCHACLGVTDKGRIIGQEVSPGTLDDIHAELRKIDPSAFPNVEIVKVTDRTGVILVRVTKNEGPFLYDGRAYSRHGASTVSMPREEFENRLIERMHATSRWENQPVPREVTRSDLDEEEIQLTLDNAIMTGRMDSPKRRDIPSILLGLGLIINGSLVNAAVALYGKPGILESLYPQFAIRLARFRGINRLLEFTDNRHYWCNAFSALRRAESFLRDHVPIAGKVVPGEIRRLDQPYYPPKATREAIANAICHRDYTIPGGAVSIAMYDDHLEIVNPGNLHFGITPESLVELHESKPWNPLIANVFYRAGIIEKWGTGTLNIIDWCRDNKNPDPVWQEQSGSVVVTFHPAAIPVTVGHESEQESRIESQIESRIESKSSALRDRIISALKSGSLSRSEIAEKLSIQKTAGQLHITIKELLNEKLIEYTIPEKPNSRLQKYRLRNPSSASAPAHSPTPVTKSWHD